MAKKASVINLCAEDQSAFDEIIQAWKKAHMKHAEELQNAIAPFRNIFDKYGLDDWSVELIPISILFQVVVADHPGRTAELPLCAALAAEMEKLTGLWRLQFPHSHPL